MSEKIRPSLPDEIDEVSRVVTSVFRQGPNPISMGITFSHLLNRNNADRIYVLDLDGTIVSVVASLRSDIVIDDAKLPVVSIGSVCTLPEYRGNGYVTRMLDVMEERFRNEGIALMLVSGTRGIYRRRHCYETGEAYQIDLAPHEFGASSGETGDFTASDLPGMVAVYERERVRFERTTEFFRVLIGDQSYASARRASARLLVHRRSGKVDAYACLIIRKDDERSIAEVFEFAGGDDAVVAILRHAASLLEVDALTVDIPNYRKPLADLLVSHGGAFQTRTIPGTVKIIDFESLWAQLTPYLQATMGADAANEIRLRREGERVKLSLHDEVAHLDQRAATNLVFSGPQLLSPSPLKSRLSSAFPLPYVHPYNLNYV